MGFNWLYSLSGNIEKNEFLEIKNNIDYLSSRLSIPVTWSNDINEPVIKRNVLKEFQDNTDLLHDNIQCFDHYATQYNLQDVSNYTTIYNDDKNGVLNSHNSNFDNGVDITYLVSNNTDVLNSDNNNVLYSVDTTVLNNNNITYRNNVDVVVNANKNINSYSVNFSSDLSSINSTYDGPFYTSVFNSEDWDAYSANQEVTTTNTAKNITII